ncbi:MAG: hypothetical protein CL885_04990 [Dehalococcoidia bacterium]|nr:hypothetical protein [Dehalococcoidia bacterium]
MASLIPDSDKESIGSVFDDIHDTFARNIVVFKRENDIFVATNSTYNALYSRIKNSPTVRTKVTQRTVKARILYHQDQREMDLPGTRAQLNVQLGEGVVRVKIDEAGYKLFSEAAKIEIDGEVFRIVSDASKVGPFVVKFYTMFLRRAD